MTKKERKELELFLLRAKHYNLTIEEITKVVIVLVEKLLEKEE